MTNPGWTWPLSSVPKTKGTRYRVLVGVLPLQPLPGGKPAELRLYLKQWDEKAADPYSWCLDLMKFAGDGPGAPMDPYQPLQHVQISQLDWLSFFDSWGQTGQWLLFRLPELMAGAPPIQQALSAD